MSVVVICFHTAKFLIITDLIWSLVVVAVFLSTMSRKILIGEHYLTRSDEKNFCRSSFSCFDIC